ncbi:hypothetical protein DF16_pBMB400orf00224 (plasmid) [Bacillus thuringiensis serovar kurstaki str. YBT-1520]|nr:hypothetical protein DF16_pBMB400orf00224 [Bacillus thuringiensis serovar kurstaki str. YBT-1520]EDZ49406.1 hypothetical protein BCAH1134_C0366 [Bacillus cereus AH1134]KAA1804877.1 hypothetical protein FXB61_004495 [Bacillus cereus]KEH45230.1 hypothetical protein BG09_6067 [Bacillus thuringiensis serovar kurstaki str. HD-1]KLA18377.1 hypothetical protein B4158_0855 [Bacillus cereus]
MILIKCIGIIVGAALILATSYLLLRKDNKTNKYKVKGY